MNSVIITQPNFLPWLGYLAQLASCDIFVCLDTVQFNRREWQNRNRIVSREGAIKFLTINVQKALRESQIREIVISQTFDQLYLLNLTAKMYEGCAGWARGLDFLDEVCKRFYQPKNLLGESNYKQILFFVQRFGFKARVVKASDLNLGSSLGTPTERILGICKSLGATMYRSSLGAYSYMAPELKKFADAGISVEWQKFVHQPYVDNKHFVSHLSLVDYLFHRSEASMIEYVHACNSFIQEPLELVK